MPARRPGFSFVELVVVLAVCALVAGIARPRMGNASARHRADYAAKRVAADLERARSVKYADAAMKPTGATLQAASLTLVSLLDTASWVDLSFSGPAVLDPTKGVCLAVTCAPTLGSGGKVHFDNASTDGGVAWMTSGDNGATLSTPTTASAMLFRAWGTATTQE